MEHQFEITVAEHGRNPESGNDLLTSFLDLSPGIEAVMDQDVDTGTLTATFIVAAEDAEAAFRQGADLFTTAVVEAGLAPTRVVAVSASACVSEESEDLLVPA